MDSLRVYNGEIERMTYAKPEAYIEKRYTASSSGEGLVLSVYQETTTVVGGNEGFFDEEPDAPYSFNLWDD